MKRMRVIGAVVIMILAVAVGGVLPVAVSYAQDESNSREITTDEIKSIDLSLNAEISIYDKLSMINHYSSAVEVDSARNMDKYVAQDTLAGELEELSDIGENYGLSVNMYDGYEIGDIWIRLYVSEKEDTKSMLVWYFYILFNDGTSATVGIDDETGTILTMSYYFENFYSGGEYDYQNGDQLSLGYMVGDIYMKYCGLNGFINEVAYEYSAVLNIEAYSVEAGGEPDVSIPIVVDYVSFSINMRQC